MVFPNHICRTQQSAAPRFWSFLVCIVGSRFSIKSSLLVTFAHVSGLTQHFFVLQIKSGSLLNRPKAVLQKLAAMSDLNPNTPRNSRNFVFHTLSPDKSEEAKEKSRLQVKIGVECAASCVDHLNVQAQSTCQAVKSIAVLNILIS